MWIAIFGAFFIFGALGLFYLTGRFHRFTPLQKLGKKHKLLSWIIAALPVLGMLCFGFINIIAAMVVLIHVMVIWFFCDLVAKMIRRLAKKERQYYPEGILAIAVSCIVLGIGWYNAHHVCETDYSFTTQKSLGGEPLRIIEIADSHLGITLDGEKFAKEMARIQTYNPDAVVVCGDFVDDDSKKEDMLEAAKALGSLKTKYGVFFIYGNHDNGYFKYRNFTSQELRDALTANNVTILEDSSVLIDDRFYLVGRLDRSFTDRAGIDELAKDLDDSKYQICLDHQPNDYAAEADAGMDLVLSGHTHGGHIYPAGYIGLWIGANDRVYGTERRGTTDYVVTSGISGWAIPFKTGTISEFCVIDITGT